MQDTPKPSGGKVKTLDQVPPKPTPTPTPPPPPRD